MLAALFSCALFFVYRRYALTLGINDDHANMMLEGEALLKGNYLLSHWYLTSVSWYTTDIMVYAIGIRLRGFNPVLMNEIPALVYLILLFASLYLAGRNHEAKNGFRWQGAMITFALIGLPLEPLAAHLLRGPWRSGSILLGLVAFILLDTDERKRMFSWRVVLLALIMGIVVITDNSPLYLIVAPILCVSALRAWQLPETRKAEATIIGATLLGVVAAKLFLRTIAAMGGFIIPDSFASHFSIIDFEHLGRNLGWTVQSLQVLYGANFWGLPLGFQVIVRFLRLASLGLIFWALFQVLRPITQRLSLRTAATVLANTDRVSLYLALGMIINLSAYWLTNIAYRLEASRYLMLFCVFGAILVGRIQSRVVWENTFLRGRVFAVAIFAAAVVLPSFALLVRRPFHASAAQRMGQWLQGQNLHDGYGAYWCSSTITTYSLKQVRVRPIVKGEKGLEPLLFGVDARWYAPEEKAYFVITNAQEYGGVTAEAVSAYFGNPNRIKTQDGYTVQIYDRDIAPLLANKPTIIP